MPTFHVSRKEMDTCLFNVLLMCVCMCTRSKRLDTFKNTRVSLSGQTSRLFKKLSYGIVLPKAAKNKSAKNKALNGFRRFKLRSCATDPSYMREKLYYDILDASQVPTARASYIR